MQIKINPHAYYSYHSSPASRTNIYQQSQSKLSNILITKSNFKEQQQRINKRDLKYNCYDNKLNKTKKNRKYQEQNQKIGDYIRNLLNKSHNILQKNRQFTIQQLRSHCNQLKKKKNKVDYSNYSQKKHNQKNVINKFPKQQWQKIQNKYSKTKKFNEKQSRPIVKLNKTEYSHEIFYDLKSQMPLISSDKHHKIKQKNYPKFKNRPFQNKKKSRKQIYTLMNPSIYSTPNDNNIENILQYNLELNLQFESQQDIEKLKKSSDKINLQEFLKIINGIKNQIQYERSQLIKTRSIRGFILEGQKTSSHLHQILENSRDSLKQKQILIITQKLKQLQQIENSYNQLKLKIQLNKKKVSFNRNTFIFKNENKELIDYYSKKESVPQQVQKQNLQIQQNSEQNIPQPVTLPNEKKQKIKKFGQKKNLNIKQPVSNDQIQTIILQKKQKQNIRSNTYIAVPNIIRLHSKHPTMKRQEKLNFQLNEGLIKKNLVQFLINCKDLNHIKQQKLQSLHQFLEINPNKNDQDLSQKSEKYKIYLQKQQKFTKTLYFQQKFQRKQSYQFDQNLIEAILKEVQRTTQNKIHNIESRPASKSSNSSNSLHSRRIIIEQKREKKEALSKNTRNPFISSQSISKVLEKNNDDLIQKQLGTNGKLQSAYIYKKNKYIVHKMKNKNHL